MRDALLDARFEADLRDALRLELASVRVGVAAPQVRGRIAARRQARRTTQLLLVAAGLAVTLLGGLVLAGRLLAPPPPAGAEPATVAAIEASTGDLVLSRAWPDGRMDEAARYAGGLDRLREATADQAATALPQDAVAMLASDGWLVVALPTGPILWFAPSDGTTDFSGVYVSGEPGWIGWLGDGRLAIVGRSVDLFDPRTGVSTTSSLPADVIPDWTRGSPQRLVIVNGTAVVAGRSASTSFESELGTLDLATNPAIFTAGLPESVGSATGLEPRYAADGSWPGSGCQDGQLLSRCAGVAVWSSAQGSAPTSTWYVTRAREALDPAPARTADGMGLLVVARATDADRGRVLVVDAPGSWRETFTFAVPAADASDVDAYVESQPYLVGVAPGGRSVALHTPAGLLVGDLAAGATTTLPTGTVFVGWPTAPTVRSESLAQVPTCAPGTVDDAASVALAAAGVTSPASAGVSPVVGARGDADPFRREELAGAPVVDAEVDGILSLALPRGACAEAATARAAPIGSAGDTTVELGAWPAGSGTIGGIAPIVAPPSGDWVVRIQLWLDGADREAILLYHVRTASP